MPESFDGVNDALTIHLGEQLAAYPLDLRVLFHDREQLPVSRRQHASQRFLPHEQGIDRNPAISGERLDTIGDGRRALRRRIHRDAAYLKQRHPIQDHGRGRRFDGPLCRGRALLLSARWRRPANNQCRAQHHDYDGRSHQSRADLYKSSLIPAKSSSCCPSAWASLRYFCCASSVCSSSCLTTMLELSPESGLPPAAFSPPLLARASCDSSPSAWRWANDTSLACRAASSSAWSTVSSCSAHRF